MISQFHRITNESLDSIVKGIMPNSSDTILAIGGSGDQAFALLQYACKVVAVDRDKEQIEYIKKLKQYLIQANYQNFIATRIGSPKIRTTNDVDDFINYEMKCGTLYFNKERLKAIHENIYSLEIMNDDVIEVLQNRTEFNKIYLSNAVSNIHMFYKEIKPSLMIIAKTLPEEGLVYVSNGTEISRLLYNTGLIVDEESSLRIKGISREWDPLVLKKEGNISQ